MKNLILILMAIAFCNQCYAAEATNSGDFTLSGNEIDLLVGTPEGIAEPLDSRRNTITKENQVDYSIFLNDDAISEEDQKTELDWSDAEENAPDEGNVQNQLMDLLAETEELEKTDEIYYGDEKEEEKNKNKNSEEE